MKHNWKVIEKLMKMYMAHGDFFFFFAHPLGIDDTHMPPR